MKLFWIFSLLFLVSCASGPSRNIASVSPVILGDIDQSHSLVKLFSMGQEQQDFQLFYLELHGDKKQLVDVALEEIQVHYNGQILEAKIKRLNQGRYEIETRKKNLKFKKLVFLVQKKQLKHHLVNVAKPVKLQSKLQVIHDTEYEATLELTLRNKKGQLIESPSAPEVIIEGNAMLSEITPVSKGVWTFKMSYSDYNQIFYFSVRANGVYLERLLRYQHIEK